MHEPRQYASDVEGGYVSGLVDGEGCFRASLGTTPSGNPFCRVEMTLNLRADDGAIVRWLRGYFGCGSLYMMLDRERNPRLNLSIGSLWDAMHAVVPHFDKYPLRAKKARDYATWRRIAMLLSDNYQRPLTGRALARARRLVDRLTDGKRFKKGGARWTR